MDGRPIGGWLTMGFLTGLLAGALSLPAGERRYIYERGRYDGQLVGRGDGGFDIFDDRNLFAGKVVPRGDGFDVFDGRGLYERTLRGR